MSVKIKSLIVSLILLIVFAGIGIGLYCAWPAITGTITDSKYYSSADVQDAYDKGFDDAFKNKEELTEQVDYYKELTDSYYISILDYQNKIKEYEAANNIYSSQIESLEQSKLDLENQVANLTEIKTNNEELISSLNSQVSTLQKEVANLTLSGQDKDEVISQKNAQISNLQTTITQLQTTNELNNQTIISLNAQIVSLNSQITEMTEQVQNNSNVVSSLNTKISELEKSVAYYEQYIANLENGEQVVATFEFNGSVCNIQIVDKNSTVSITNPAGTEHVIFNYWTVNGEQVDLATYQLTANTKFVANVTYKYDVLFMVDNEEFDSQLVIENGFATLPSNPTKEGYEFDGWSLNGVDIVNNITSTSVTQNVTYQAVFTKVHSVTFSFESEIKSSQSIRNGNYATAPVVDSTTFKVFNGWKVNGTLVDVSTYKILADTVFVADITYKFNVVFTVEGNEYDSQIVVENGFATLPANPTKEGYDFVGWSIDSNNIINNINSIEVQQNTTYVALFKSNTWEKITWPGEDVHKQFINGLYVWTDGEEIYYSDGSRQYVLNKGSFVWEDKIWNGLTSFDGRYIWTDGQNVYYSFDSQQYVLDKETSTWTVKTWNGLTSFRASGIWTDGQNIYYSNGSEQYVLNKETSTWVVKAWNGLTNFYGEYVWTDGQNTYYSTGLKQYVLNKETSTWLEKTWNGDLNLIDPDYIWTDGECFYYSYNSDQYKLDVSLFVGNSVAWADYMGAYIYDYSPSGFGSEGDEFGSVLGFVPNACAVILNDEELIITFACYDEGSDSIIYAGETYLESGLVQSWIVEDFDNGKFKLSYKLDEELIDAECFYVDNSQLMYNAIALQKVSSATEAA